MTRKIALVVAVVLAGYLVWPYAFTAVPIDQAGSFDEIFDPVTYVDGIWDDIESTTQTDAVNLGELLGAMAPDAKGLIDKGDLGAVTATYGLITPGEAHVYLVMATGTATTVDTGSSVGTMALAVDGYEGPIQAEVYVGPRIPSDESSVRDAVGFLTFGDFKDQTEYGKVASEINNRVSALLAAVDVASLEGKPVTVYGAMTIRTFNLVQIDVRTVHIVPIAVEVR